MQFSLSRDEAGRLLCQVRGASESALVTSSDAVHDGPELASAVEDALEGGFGECYWREAGGNYHWMFRREGSVLRIAVLWSTGTVTGWEHKFFGECGLSLFRSVLTTELEKVGLGAGVRT